MRAVVTGAAGFIGSTLCDTLLQRGDDLVAVDCFTPYYPQMVKERNASGFEVTPIDLRSAELRELVEDVDVVFHLAAQPGVRASWSDFDECESHNVLATQRLLDAATAAPNRPRVVFASSSSVYGSAGGAVGEEAPLHPRSPYGVTKLAGEHLCVAYAEEFGLRVTILRLFTVYGPRQRPDMAIHRLIDSALGGPPFPLYGDGQQRRDFTFVTDVVAALLAAAEADVKPASVFNVAGGSSVALVDLIEAITRAAGGAPSIERHDRQRGDVPATEASIERATTSLGWIPQVKLTEGIEAQVAWHRSNRR